MRRTYGAHKLVDKLPIIGKTKVSLAENHASGIIFFGWLLGNSSFSEGVPGSPVSMLFEIVELEKRNAGGGILAKIHWKQWVRQILTSLVFFIKKPIA